MKHILNNQKSIGIPAFGFKKAQGRTKIQMLVISKKKTIP
jgi:hypothetical protein